MSKELTNLFSKKVNKQDFSKIRLFHPISGRPGQAARKYGFSVLRERYTTQNPTVSHTETDNKQDRPFKIPSVPGLESLSLGSQSDQDRLS